MTPAQRARKRKERDRWRPAPDNGAEREHRAAQHTMAAFDKEPFVIQEFMRRHGYSPNKDQRKFLLAGM